MKTTEIGNYRIEERSRKLYGSHHFAVWRVGKKQPDGITDLHSLGWYPTHDEAMAAVSQAREKRKPSAKRIEEKRGQ